MVQQLFPSPTVLRGGHLLAMTFLLTVPPLLAAQEATPVDSGWPRVHAFGTDSYTVYQPQSDSWNGNQYAGHAAVAVKTVGQTEPSYGVFWFTARTDVDKDNRMVYFEDFVITKGHFPSAPNQTETYVWELQKLVPASYPIALDRLETEVAVSQAMQASADVAVKNSPPQIIFSVIPAMLVLVDGKPDLRAVPGVAGVQRVVNTTVLLLNTGGKYYLHVFDGWMQAVALDSQWTVATKPPKSLTQAMTAVTNAGPVNLLQGEGTDSTQPKPTLAKGPVPVVYLRTVPAELIVTNGPPDYAPIEGTNLLYVTNTSGFLFKDLVDENNYLLISGRWFRSASLTGLWTWVPGTQLPKDFSEIPVTSPVENVLASVPGTVEAQEAMVANNIPQTATIPRTGTTITPKYDGTPELEPIEGTTLQYVENSPIPVIMTGPNSYYAVQSGIWFVSSSVQGPWMVATSVPVVIYTIPPSSPLYNVTYVQVYGYTSQVVYVGYTSGYYGTVVSGGVVVYGTGYVYPVYVGTVYYPPPATYGMSVAIVYAPYAGWHYGYGYGCYPYYNPYHYNPYAYTAHYGGTVYGPGGYATTSGWKYNQSGSTSSWTRSSSGYNAYTGNSWQANAGESYNSATGVAAEGHASYEQNQYTGNYQNYESGAARNTQTGTVAAGQATTVGNTNTGQAVSAAHGEAYNPYTGQSASVSGVSSTSGNSAEKVSTNNNTYADVNGNVYKQGDDGSWQQYNGSNSAAQSSESKYNQSNSASNESKPQQGSEKQSGGSGSWSKASDQQAQSLNSQSQARQSGESRSSGGWGGGGGRGGGGRR